MKKKEALGVLYLETWMGFRTQWLSPPSRPGRSSFRLQIECMCWTGPALPSTPVQRVMWCHLSAFLHTELIYLPLEGQVDLGWATGMPSGIYGYGLLCPLHKHGGCILCVWKVKDVWGTAWCVHKVQRYKTVSMKVSRTGSSRYPGFVCWLVCFLIRWTNNQKQNSG